MEDRNLAQSPPAHPFENPGAAWLAAMRRGDFEAAWAVNDHVLAQRDPAERDDPRQPYHLRWVWDGRAFEGRDVLVRCYHGLGDTLQFCRYLPSLRRLVRSLSVEMQPELIPLLATLAGPDRLIAFRPEQPAPPSACDLEIMELAHALRQRPSAAPYLQLDGQAGRDPSFRVGLCWHVTTGWAPERSIPLPLLAPLGEIAGVTLLSLQRGPGVAQLALPGAPAVANPDERGADMLATARLVASLDLVVTIDTMVAHLAGALGVPVWLLLGQAPDWRWLAGGSGSPWYRKLRKYRQSVAGDWSGPVAALAADLTRAARGHSVAGT